MLHEAPLPLGIENEHLYVGFRCAIMSAHVVTEALCILSNGQSRFWRSPEGCEPETYASCLLLTLFLCLLEAAGDDALDVITLQEREEEDDW